MSTLILVRTECCESYKHCGMRCSNCPGRPGNREAALNCQQQLSSLSFGRRTGVTQHHASPDHAVAARISPNQHP